MRRKPFIILTAAAALALGAGLAWVLFLVRPGLIALDRIDSADFETRQAGWTWLTSSAERSGRRLQQFMPQIQAVLADAGDEVFLHGMAELDRAGRWNWQDQPRPLMHRALMLRAQHDDADTLDSLRRDLGKMPDDISSDLILEIAQVLLDRPQAKAWWVGMESACHWLGPERAGKLADLRLPDLKSAALNRTDNNVGERIRLHRLYHLAIAWQSVFADSAQLDQHRSRVSESNADTDLEFEIDANLPLDVLEAMLVRAVRSHPDHVQHVIRLMDEWDRPAPQAAPRPHAPAFAHIIHLVHTETASRALRRLAAQGNEPASLMVQMRSPPREDRAARDRVADNTLDPALRRLAAWRLDRISDASLDDLLATPPAYTDDSVYAAVLLAERHLPTDRAAELAEMWLRSFDLSERRAGALLAALIGEHGDLVREALAATADAKARIHLEAARIALQRDRHERIDRERLWRAVRADGVDPDITLCLLMIGDVPAIAFLTSDPTPVGDRADHDQGGTRDHWRREVQMRAWMIERFVPHWHEVMGRPVGGDGHGLRLHFDQLEALRLLSSGRLKFDADSVTFHQ